MVSNRGVGDPCGRNKWGDNRCRQGKQELHLLFPIEAHPQLWDRISSITSHFWNRVNLWHDFLQTFLNNTEIFVCFKHAPEDWEGFSPAIELGYHSKMRSMMLMGKNSLKSIFPMMIPQSWATREPCKMPSNSKFESKTDSCTKDWKTR